MPIYEYRCDACSHQLEVLQKLSDPVLSDCPACQQPALKRLISPVGFRLKGGGWYETDFKSGKKRNLADGGKPESKDGGKAESKPAAKTDGSGKSADTSSSKTGGTKTGVAAA